MADNVLYDESQSEIIAKAQAQVDTVRSCGKQLIEALAAGGEPAVLSQKVTAVTSAAEAAIAALDAHVQVLGPVLRAASERPAKAEKAARAKVLQKRKDAGHAATPPSDFADESESEVLELVAQRVSTATGLPVELKGSSDSKADAAAAREVHMRVEGVMCAMVALAAAGRPEAARVVLMSAEEVLSGKDAWDSSCHQVFRDLFTRPCSVTGKLLALDAVTNQLLPPIVRPFKRSRSVLLAMASGSEPCQAFHPHVEAATEDLP